MASRNLTKEQARGEGEYTGCGIGTPDCCIFLALGPDGFSCEQRGGLRDHLVKRHQEGSMNASRKPEGDFPACQDEGRSER